MEDKNIEMRKDKKTQEKMTTRHKVLGKKMVFGTWIDVKIPSATLGRLVVHWSHLDREPCLGSTCQHGL